VNAATGKSVFMCVSCITPKELVKNNDVEYLFDCSASPVSDNNPLSVQLRAVRLERVCTMEMVKTLTEMVTKLSCEVQHLKSDNAVLKLRLSDLHQIHAPLPSMQTGVVPSVRTPNVAAKTYSDILTSGGGSTVSTVIPLRPNPQPSLPGSSATATNNPSRDGLETVLGKMKGKPFFFYHFRWPKPQKKSRTSLFSARMALLFQLCRRKSEPRHFLSHDSHVMLFRRT
jgi:hypothetical protein